jgi:hypothetical protein
VSHEHDHPRASLLLSALGLDLEASLGEEPRFLLDARFLGSLHVELREEIGAADAAAALIQLGFVHGLRDATELVRDGLAAGPLGAAEGQPASSRLLLALAPPLSRAGTCGFDVSGSWPDRHEAEAVRAVLGAQTEPVCFVSTGYTSGWASGIFGADLLVVESACAAAGAAACRFRAREPVAWRTSGDARAEMLLRALPFETLREMVARRAATREPPPSREGLDSGTPVIHVWGPVMVIPFSGVDESLRAIELIGRDPGARDVRVVVIDLAGAVLDDGFGAVALERILAAVEGWAAEPILTGVSPLCGSVIAGLERPPAIVRKDLADAIAAAFQVAEAMRFVS